MLEIATHKSALARLMAEENILVEQKAVSSSCFDTGNRVLTLPILKEDLSSDVTDLLISHEIGHALYTSHENWMNSLQDVRKSILNMVEDARIEKLIKRKYPGLRNLYYRAYKELNAIDFFGLSKMDMSRLNLADRMNMYFKVGLHTEISFTDDERLLVKKVSECETFDDVYSVSLEIQEYMRKLLNKSKDVTSENFENEIKEKDECESCGFSESSEGSENSENSKRVDDESDESDEEKNFDQSNVNPDSDSLAEDLDEDLDSKTQIHSESNWADLLSNENRESVYVDIPDKDINEIIVDYKYLYKRLYSSLTYNRISEEFYSEFIKDSYPAIQYLVREFLLRKKAEGRKRIKLSKTGEICTSKIHRYKITDDIFRKNTIIANSQSHGLVFFLDWSGSMERTLHETVKQLIELLLFCKKTNIPYEVYTFTNGYYDEGYGYSEFVALPKTCDDINIIQKFNLMNIFSSRMTNNEFVKAAGLMLHITANNPYRKLHPPHWFSLRDTPLNDTIVISDLILNDFKQKTKVDIVNAIYLTDGVSTPLRTSPGNYYMLSDRANDIYLRNKKTKNVKLLERNKNMFTYSGYVLQTEACISFVKQNLNCRMFGFRITPPKSFNSVFKDFDRDSYETEKARKIFMKEGCFNFEKSNFDAFFFIKECKRDSTAVNINVDKSVKMIATAFEKNLNGSLSNKIFLKKFIEFIA